MSGAQDVDLEEGLEEALDSLSLDHVTQVSRHVTHYCLNHHLHLS